jgi:hypothetical protein
VLMLLIADMANDDGTCYPGNARIAGKCRVKERQVQKLVDKCETDGELAVVENGGIETGHGKTNLYVVLGLRYATHKDVPGARTPKPKGVSRRTSHKKTDGVSSTTSQGVSSGTSLGVSSATPKPLVEPSEEPKDITPSNPVDLTELFTDFDEVEKAQPKKFGFKEAVMHVWGLEALSDGRNGMEVNFMGLLSGKGKKGSKWEEHHLDDPATTEEVLAFGGWYADKEPDRDKPPVTAEGINNNFLLFRQSSTYQEWLEVGREQLKLFTLPPQLNTPQTPQQALPESDDPEVQDYSADINALIDQIANEKDGGYAGL